MTTGSCGTLAALRAPHSRAAGLKEVSLILKIGNMEGE
jgi:hypothetical protein